MGRNPKPTNIKKLQGTFRPDRILPGEPQPEIVIPKCPTWLKGLARREWKRITPKLFALGCVSEIDVMQLASYCLAVQMVADCTKIIEEEGLTCLTSKGTIVQRPEVGMRNTAMSLLKSFGAEFGMSPASRTRISVAPPAVPKDNEFSLVEKTGTW